MPTPENQNIPSVTGFRYMTCLKCCHRHPTYTICSRCTAKEYGGWIPINKFLPEEDHDLIEAFVTKTKVVYNYENHFCENVEEFFVPGATYNHHKQVWLTQTGALIETDSNVVVTHWRYAVGPRREF